MLLEKDSLDTSEAVVGLEWPESSGLARTSAATSSHARRSIMATRGLSSWRLIPLLSSGLPMYVLLIHYARYSKTAYMYMSSFLFAEPYEVVQHKNNDNPPSLLVPNWRLPGSLRFSLVFIL